MTDRNIEKNDSNLLDINDNIQDTAVSKESIDETKEESIDLDDGFMDEINELKEEGEKKSFFGGLFGKKKEKVEAEENNIEEVIKENKEEDNILNIDEEINKTEEVESIDETKEEPIDLDDGFMDEINELKEEGEKKSFFGGLFGKKKEKIEVEENNIEENNSKVSDNIFDDFNQDESLVDEVDQIKKDRDRDVFFYFEKVSGFFQVLFILGLILLAIVYSYIYVQNKIYDKADKDNQLLGPLCFILLNNVQYNGNFCTSIATLNDEYITRLNNTKEQQVDDILNILQRLYKIESFTKTKDVIFLKNKTENKLKILTILSEFDNLKNEFDTISKDKIECSGISIDQNTSILKMTCNAYSAGYEKGIRGLNGKNDINSLVKGTSISIANSFLNYINLESKIFTINDKQKVFKSASIVGIKTGFTNKTSFSLKLKYNLD